MGEITLDLRLVIKIPEKGLRINGLIGGLKKATPKINEAILVTLFKALEDKVVEMLKEKDPGRYVSNGHQSKVRKLKCSLGEVAYRFAQMVDREKERTFLPLAKALQIPAYDHYLHESLEPSLGLVVHVSYRRAAKEAKRIQGRGMSPSTLHTRLQEFAQAHEPFGNLQKTPFRFLLVDGTKVRLQGAAGDDLGQGEMRWALASRGAAHPFEPVGFWIDTDWAHIRQDLNSRLNYGKLQILFSDGAPGIEENLLAPGMKHQRCLWHGKRDFPYLFYLEGLKKAAQGPFLERLKSIPVFNLTKDNLEQLRPEDRPKIEGIIKQTQKGFQKLLQALDAQKYPKARVYIQNLLKPVTTFLSWWLDKGEVIPMTTNAIESAFSQVCNRIKRIGRRWSEKGLINWLTITFFKIFKPQLWKLQWLDNEKKNREIKLISIQISYHWSNAIT